MKYAYIQLVFTYRISVFKYNEASTASINKHLKSVSRQKLGKCLDNRILNN